MDEGTRSATTSPRPTPRSSSQPATPSAARSHAPNVRRCSASTNAARSGCSVAILRKRSTVVSGPATRANVAAPGEYRSRPMPSSKDVRARQNRQRERIAAQHAERQRVTERRRRIALAGVLVIFVAAVALVLVVMNKNDDKKSAATPTTPPTTSAELASVK